MNMDRRRPLCCALVAWVLVGVCHADDFSYDQAKHPPLQKLWGIPDTTAQTGYLFHYQIPKNAFDGNIARYKASSENDDSLPSWLVFHEKSGVFEGVPSEEDVGENYITVKAFDEELHDSVKDIFALEVLSKPSQATERRFTYLENDCKKLEDKTILSLILDVNYKQLTPKQKMTVIKDLARFLSLKTETLYIGNLNRKNELLSNSVIEAGPGNVNKKLASSSTSIEWQVGCEGNVWNKLTSLIDNIRSSSRDGTLAEVVQFPIIGWKLSRKESDYRQRREIPGMNSLEFVDEVVDGVPDPRVVVGNSETPLFQLEPSPTYSVPAPPMTHRRRHHRGEHTESFMVLPTSSISPTPTYIPRRPTSHYSIEAISPSNVSPSLGSPSASPLFEAEGTAESNVTERWTTGAQTETESSEEPTPSLSSVPTTFVEEEINSAPIIGQRLQKLHVTAGKMLKYAIPENAFTDTEDGNTRNLKLTLLTSEGSPLSENSWIHFNNATQEIYALPLEEHVSKWIFTLKATDSGNLSTSDKIEVSVQNHKGRRTVNHAMTAELMSTPLGLPLDWELNLLAAISETFSDPDTSHITVLDVSFNPISFTWTNDTTPRNGCPQNEIDNSFKKLDSIDGLRRFLPPSIRLNKLTLTGKGPCDSKPPEIPPAATNYAPAPRNQVDYLNATVGQLLIFSVPEDTFYDPEDGSTRNLKLSLLAMDRTRLQPNHWLQFDSKNQEFYGIPMDVNVGQWEYQLVCEDSGGKSASDGLVVIVHSAPRVMYNVEFSMKLDLDYNVIVDDPKMQRTFVERLAELFGDYNTSSIVLSGFAPGSTIITWHNKSLPINVCPNSEIVRLRQIMLKDDEKITPAVARIMGKEFPVLTAKLTPTGYCQGALTEIHTGGTETAPNDVTAVSHAEHYVVGLVIPALVIAVMLLCAGLVACILYRRKRTGKMSVGDEDERQTFRSKGIPVIFQDELDERPEPTNKSPVIMKEEKPPLPPPEYHRGPPLATTALLSDAEDSPYQPPPPFTTNRDSARPKPTPTYRMPPPFPSSF